MEEIIIPNYLFNDAFHIDLHPMGAWIFCDSRACFKYIFNLLLS